MSNSLTVTRPVGVVPAIRAELEMGGKTPLQRAQADTDTGTQVIYTNCVVEVFLDIGLGSAGDGWCSTVGQLFGPGARRCVGHPQDNACQQV